MTTSVSGSTISSPNCTSRVAQRSSCSHQLLGWEDVTDRSWGSNVVCPLSSELGPGLFPFPPVGPKAPLTSRGSRWNSAVQIPQQQACTQVGMLSSCWRSQEDKIWWKIRPFRCKNFSSPRLKQSITAILLTAKRGLSGQKVIGSRAHKYLALEHSYPIWSLPHTGTSLRWPGWCHLENSFWLTYQRPSRGRKTNGVLGVRSQDRKAVHLVRHGNHSKWGRLWKEIQSLGSDPILQTGLIKTNSTHQKGSGRDPRKGWGQPWPGEKSRGILGRQRQVLRSLF